MEKPVLPKAERDEIRITMWIMGVIVPLVVLWFAQDAWITEKAKWPIGGRSGRWVEVEGLVAKSLGVAYLGAAITCFSNWWAGYFWYHRMRYLGVILGSIMFIAGVIAGLIFMAQ